MGIPIFYVFVKLQYTFNIIGARASVKKFMNTIDKSSTTIYNIVVDDELYFKERWVKHECPI